jgi:hypothetical protein
MSSFGYNSSSDGHSSSDGLMYWTDDINPQAAT